MGSQIFCAFPIKGSLCGHGSCWGFSGRSQQSPLGAARLLSLPLWVGNLQDYSAYAQFPRHCLFLLGGRLPKFCSFPQVFAGKGRTPKCKHCLFLSGYHSAIYHHLTCAVPIAFISVAVCRTRRAGLCKIHSSLHYLA